MRPSHQRAAVGAVGRVVAALEEHCVDFVSVARQQLRTTALRRLPNTNEACSLGKGRIKRRDETARTFFPHTCSYNFIRPSMRALPANRISTITCVYRKSRHVSTQRWSYRQLSEEEQSFRGTSFECRWCELRRICKAQLEMQHYCTNTLMT